MTQHMRILSPRAQAIAKACPASDSNALEYFEQLEVITPTLSRIARQGLDKGHCIGFGLDMVSGRVVKVFWIPKKMILSQDTKSDPNHTTKMKGC